mmetsp:Transcript_23111/g.39270  ORF Transcript_23111/g.39270 Transcript_23111/m.39270 type:complete len:144 (+) Transcript_23111:29-460(+)
MTVRSISRPPKFWSSESDGLHMAGRRRRRPEFSLLTRVSNFHVANENDWYELSVEVPGVKSKNLVVTIDGNLLRLTGSRKILSANGRVRRNFKFIKSFPLDDEVDTERLGVHLAHGVLVVSGPKKSSSTDLNPKRRRINLAGE